MDDDKGARDPVCDLPPTDGCKGKTKAESRRDFS
jgi:hypothetical protein